jgi:hypothetical protein
MASAACMKIAGVPVEFKVATILLAIMALLPIPVIITLPLDWYINWVACAKSSSNKFDKLEMALLSKLMVFFAVLMIDFAILKIYNYWFDEFKDFIIFKMYYKKTKKNYETSLNSLEIE